MDITQTTAAKSDQQNFDDYLVGPRVVTVSEVTGGSAEQPVELHLVEFPDRPYKPSKSMRRVLVASWGPETSVYVGRKMRLYGDPDVKFGGITVGGIKIAALSHIDKTLKIALTVTRGKREPHTVEPLTDTAPPATKSLAQRVSGMVIAFEGKGITVTQLETRIGKDSDSWTADDVEAMTAVFGQLKAGVSVDELFPTSDNGDPTFPGGE